MLKKKSLMILVGLVLFAAACNGPDDFSSFQNAQLEQVEQGQQFVQDQQGQQDAPNSAVNNPASDSNTSNSAGVNTNNIAGLFSDNVTVTFTDTYMIVETDGIPSHEIDASVNPNTPTAQNFTFQIPLNPQLADTPTDTPMGPIGIAVSGAVFYNGYNSSGGYAVELEVLDHCGGHADERGVYHYHEESDCIHGNLIGYAFDGFEVRKSIENDGTAVTGLDICNGHDYGGEYHYHATDDPSKPLLGCYSGVVETSNLVGGSSAPAGNQGAGAQDPTAGPDADDTGSTGRGPGGGGRGPGGGGGGQRPGGGGGGGG